MLLLLSSSLNNTVGLFQVFALITQKAHCTCASTKIQENKQQLMEIKSFCFHVIFSLIVRLDNDETRVVHPELDVCIREADDLRKRYSAGT